MNIHHRKQRIYHQLVNWFWTIATKRKESATGSSCCSSLVLLSDSLIMSAVPTGAPYGLPKISPTISPTVNMVGNTSNVQWQYTYILVIGVFGAFGFGFGTVRTTNFMSCFLQSSYFLIPYNRVSVLS